MSWAKGSKSEKTISQKKSPLKSKAKTSKRGSILSKYKRVLLKLSGEALASDSGFGINPTTINDIAREIADVLKLNVQIGIVIGGGNIFRGIAASAQGMDRSSSDYMGMLATCI